MNGPVRPAVCCLLLAGMAYALGASPCGCWEHSGWRAAVALASGEAPTGSSDGQARVEQHECDGAPVTATAVARRTMDDRDEALDAAAFTAGHTLSGQPVEREYDRSAPLAVAGPAPPVRAALQVFRL